ncbi:MAG: DUF3348 family protein [Aquabacterium sp.]
MSLSHSPLSRPALVRLLQPWVPAAGEPVRQDVAERLGEWLSAVDSVKLDGALQAIASYGAQHAARQRGAHRPGATAVDAAGLAALSRRMHAEMAEQITQTLAALEPADAAEPAAYGPVHQRYLALQKRMEAKVSACRAQVRQVLSKGSPRLRQLAALDGVMAEMLAEREQKLLAAVPVYLERRFAQAQQQAADHDAGRLAFLDDMRQVLMAEWQTRMHPVQGLIESAQEEDVPPHAPTHGPA